MTHPSSTARRARVFIASAAIALTAVLAHATPAQAHSNTCKHGTTVYSGTYPLWRAVFYSHETVARRHFHYYHHQVYNFNAERWETIHNFSTEC